MTLFGRRPRASASSQLPGDIVGRVTHYGQHEFDPRGYRGPDINATVYQILYPQASADPAGFTERLSAALLPAGGWAVYGGARLVPDLCDRQQISGLPAYLALLDAALDFLHDSGVGRDHLNHYEWQRWCETRGPHAW